MIDNSYLLGLFGGTPLSSGTSGGLPSAAPRKVQPTPPGASWTQAPAPPAAHPPAQGGPRIIDESAARLDVKGASADYRKLFALYQGLETLNLLSNRAATQGVGALETSQLQKRFSAGLAEIGKWLQTAEFDAVRMVQGAAASRSKSTAAVPRDSAISLTGPIHEGSPDSPVAAFAGDVRFDIVVRRSDNSMHTVSIDLVEMGAEPRSLTKVLEHINGKLEAAGLQTRLGRELIKAETRSVTVNGKPVLLPTGPDRYALAVRGVSTETVRFAPAETADAVYVVQTAGTAGGLQMLKFQSDTGGAAPPPAVRVGETHWVDGRAAQTALPEGIETVRASAAAADGSVWLVADLKTGLDDQPIKGERDVALVKLDSAGRVVTTRALGAASSASGYAIAVDADGRVAVAGSVTGALEPGQSGDVATVVDSFVTVFDGEGEEIWTRRRGARAEDEATSVTFGPNGAVYVAGRARSAMPGAAAEGGWDGYLQGWSESQAHQFAPVVASSSGVLQFGTAGADGVDAVAVDGNTLYAAGIESGRIVVRRFSLDASGRPTLDASRDLGEASGEIAGLAVSGGQLIVTGTTRNAALDVGTVTSAHQGGRDAFVALIDSSLTASAGDRLTYVGGAGDDTAADMKVQGGKVWITGVADRPEGAKETDPTAAFLARIDPATGGVEWRRDWEGDGRQAAPLTLATAAGGASVLDRLGLPQGEIDQKPSRSLVTATSLRVGDRFYISPADGGRAVPVTIEARDTLQSLARKIEQASRMKLKVTVASEAAEAPRAGEASQALHAGVQSLSIVARDGVTGAVLGAGETGRDALAGLGLSPGFIGQTSGDEVVRTFGMGLSAGLNLGGPESIKAAGEALQAAMKAVRDAYRALAPASTLPGSAGPAPAYLTAQIANYEAALARLGG